MPLESVANRDCVDYVVSGDSLDSKGNKASEGLQVSVVSVA